MLLQARSNNSLPRIYPSLPENSAVGSLPRVETRQDASFIPRGYILYPCFLEVFLPGLLVARPGLEKINVRGYHGLPAFKISFQQEMPEGEKIKKTTSREGCQVSIPRHVLVKHQQVITEIKVHLLGVIFAQRSPTHVVHGRRGHAHHLSAAGVQPPAKVYLLHVREKAAIQPTMRGVVVLTDQQASAGRPKNGNRFIVLAPVLLHH